MLVPPSVPRTLAVALLALPSAAGVIVVDASGVGDFTDLPAAVAAAVDGDVLLVKAGAYSGFTITDKELDIIAEAGITPLVSGAVRVTQLSVTRSVTLSGLRIDGPNYAPPATEPALRLTGDAGAVRLQGLDVRGSDAANCVGGRWGGSGLDVASCSNVVVSRCSLRGGRGADDGHLGGGGGRGLQITGSTAAVYDCNCVGGDGGDLRPACGYDAGYGEGGNGQPGVGTYASNVFFSNVRMEGGDGGDAFQPNSEGGCAASGLYSQNGGTERVLDVQYVPGVGGAPTNICGAGAPPTQIHQTLLVTLPGAARRMTTPRVAREQQFVRVDFTGQPGDHVQLVSSQRARFLYSDALRGVSHLETDRIVDAGVIGASGKLSLGWTVPELGAGVEERLRYLQAVFVDTSGVTTLGTPETIVLLDSGF